MSRLPYSSNGNNGKHVRSLTREQQRARVDFLPLPEDAVGDFVNRVSQLPLADWIAIGRVAASCQSMAPTPASVHALVQQTVTNNHLTLRAWEIRDAIDSLAIRQRGNHRLVAQDVALITMAAAAMRDAALSLLLRDHLPASVLEAQCALCASLFRRQPASA